MFFFDDLKSERTLTRTFSPSIWEVFKANQVKKENKF